MSQLIALADAVVSHLNQANYALPLVAQRYYLPEFALADMATLHVSVVPKGVTISSLDRGRDAHDYEIDVAIQQKTDGTTAQLDALVGLVEEIADSFRNAPLAGCPQARSTAVKNVPVYAVEHLNELHQFTSIVTLTFRVAR